MKFPDIQEKTQTAETDKVIISRQVHLQNIIQFSFVFYTCLIMNEISARCLLLRDFHEKYILSFLKLFQNRKNNVHHRQMKKKSDHTFS